MLNNILQNLKEKYVGQIFEKGYGSWTEIGQYVCERLEHEYKVPFTYTGTGHKGEELMIQYRGWGVIKIIFKKKKGDQHHNLYRGYYFIWHIKDIEIQNCIGYGNLNENSTIQDHINEIDIIVNRENERRSKRDAVLTEGFNLLKDHFNLETNSEVRNLIEDMDRAYYRLFYNKED